MGALPSDAGKKNQFKLDVFNEDSDNDEAENDNPYAKDSN